MPETVRLEGWTDDDGEMMTSCVLRLVEGVTADTKPLTGSKKVAFDALVSIGEDYVHVEKWRAAAYAAGITASVSSEAKKKAFQRAVMDLPKRRFCRYQERFLVAKQPGQRDKRMITITYMTTLDANVPSCPGLSRFVPLFCPGTYGTHTFRCVPVVPLAGVCPDERKPDRKNQPSDRCLRTNRTGNRDAHFRRTRGGLPGDKNAADGGLHL
jgi:hypothetical protein